MHVTRDCRLQVRLIGYILTSLMRMTALQFYEQGLTRHSHQRSTYLPLQIHLGHQSTMKLYANGTVSNSSQLCLRSHVTYES